MIYKSNSFPGADVLIDEYFDKVLYINMNKDKERNEHMIKQFEKFNIKNYERIEAVEPSNDFDLSLSQIVDSIEPSQYRNFIKKEDKYIVGQYYCRASHIKAVQYAKEKNYKRILMLEDDVVFVTDPNKLLKNNTNILNDWDMLYFGGLIEHVFRNQIVETHAYALNQKIYDDIIHMGVSSGMEMDNFYAKIIQQMSYNYNTSGKYNIRIIMPFNHLIQNKGFNSNIQNS